ncbi:hypothetical protein JVU11DRAFT_8252 [Chiua virens]|nr:hypothetical protein JVU11DRAFT_8252 [Chiua virens]
MRVISREKCGAGRKYRGFTSDESPLNEFFTKHFPEFQHDPAESALREFYRLCDELRWDRDGVDGADAHQDFKEAW